jgi:phytoene dehydrogenase-like protein
MTRLQPSTLRIGRRYRPGRLNGPYDALVIGSGIGGLTTAALLAELGWKVAVLEQHYTAGGCTHSYERNGYEWDVGVHYIGDMGAKTTTRRLMDFLTQGDLAWAPMDSHYDRFFIGDRVYDAVAGREAFRDNLVGYFPREAAAIDRYLGLLGEVSRGMRTYSLARTLPPCAGAIAGPILRSRPRAAAEALGVSRSGAGREALSPWRLLSGRRRLAHRRDDPAAYPRDRGRGLHLCARAGNPAASGSRAERARRSNGGRQ